MFQIYDKWHKHPYHPHTHWTVFVVSSLVLSFYIISVINYSNDIGPNLFQTNQVRADVTTDLVAHWKFDEGSGTTAADSSGNGNNGTIIGGSSWTTGKIGGGLTFDGVDDYVQTAKDIDYNNFTISTWVKFDSCCVFTLIRQGPNGFWLRSGAQAGFYVGWAPISIPTNMPSYSVFHHMAVTYDGTSLKYYLDGSLIESVLALGIPDNPSAPPVIGKDTENIFYLNGVLDDMRVYNRAISSTEVSELYNYNPESTPYPTPYPTPYAYPYPTPYAYPYPYPTPVPIPAGTSITVNTPTQPWAGTVNIGVTVNNKIDSDSNITHILIDGEPIGAPATYPMGVSLTTPFYTTGKSQTFTYDTTRLSNGSHQFYVRVLQEGKSLYGEYGPVTITVDNGHIPWQLRANFNELWLTPGQSISLIPKLVYSDKTITSLSAASVTFTTADSSIASVSSGSVTAQALGDTMVTMTYGGLINNILVHVNPQNVTPHFGKDGSILTSYDPSKSMFVRSMFSLDPVTANSDPNYISDLYAAKVNTLETGFYLDPSGFSDPATWRTALDNRNSIITSIANRNDFSLLLIGDDIARGSNAVYEGSRGNSTSWNPNPIAYAFTWAKNLGKVIGVEMVDEISSSFSAPFPQGRLGSASGPQQISCVNNVCTVSWPNPVVNGALLFLIRGATTDTDLNRPVTNLYTLYNFTSAGFSFNATGVGTRTFTSASDPNLTMEMFAAVPLGSGGTDYVHNDAFSVIMSYINSVSGRPKITWPAAAAAPPYYFGKWVEPGASDYADLYYTFFGTSYQDGGSLSDALTAFKMAWNLKYPEVQKTKPTLFLSSISGPMYRIGGVSVPVVSITNDTVVFTQPHNIKTTTNPDGRFTLSGNSNAAFNTKYKVSQIVDSLTLKVYLNEFGNTSWSYANAGTYDGNFNFADGTVKHGVMSHFAPHQSQLDFNNEPGCATDNLVLPQKVTVSNLTIPAWNGEYIAISKNGCLGVNIRAIPSGSGIGGIAKVVATNGYQPGVSDLMIPGSRPSIVAANIVYAAEKGMAGVRAYSWGNNLNNDHATNSLFDGEPVVGDGVQPGSNPRYNGADSVIRWQAMSNANNLISQIEPYLLQPKLHSPDYGPMMITAARTSSYGKMLMMTNFLENPVTEMIDLSEYNPSGGSGTRYRMTSNSLSNSSISGSTQSITFAPGETVVWTFPPSSSPLPTLPPPPTPPTASTTQFIINDRIYANPGAGSNLNVRATANGAILGTQVQSALGTIVGGPTKIEGFNWWNINFDTATDGWAREDFLEKYIIASITPAVTSAGGGGGGGGGGNSLTEEEQIAILLAKIAELQALIHSILKSQQGINTSVSTTPCTFTQDLFLGMSGEDVRCLQKYLNASGFIVSSTGNGSPGNEITYYGLGTKAAVLRWQQAHNLTPTVGYFGPKSIEKYLELTK